MRLLAAPRWAWTFPPVKRGFFLPTVAKCLFIGGHLIVGVFSVSNKTPWGNCSCPLLLYESNWNYCDLWYVGRVFVTALQMHVEVLVLDYIMNMNSLKAKKTSFHTERCACCPTFAITSMAQSDNKALFLTASWPNVCTGVKTGT